MKHNSALYLRTLRVLLAAAFNTVSAFGLQDKGEL
jgi:hypothetical protein